MNNKEIIGYLETIGFRENKTSYEGLTEYNYLENERLYATIQGDFQCLNLYIETKKQRNYKLEYVQRRIGKIDKKRLLKFIEFEKTF